MSCKSIHDFYGYQVCVLEREAGSTLFNRDLFLIIRKGNKHLEIVNVFDKNNIKHEMGDKLPKESIEKSIFNWIEDNYEYCITEIEKYQF